MTILVGDAEINSSTGRNCLRVENCRNLSDCVDAALISSKLLIPLEAGLHYFGVRSTYILGLQIGLNFVPATKTEIRNDGLPVIFCRHEIEFFLWSKCNERLVL
ncbi:MAG: hypothetical protein DME55_10530 [Verrucomicrobia bacterium]|nr:MAG: hypothetical protein DME55_10530 [Verrucomicrobiota bacterium]